VCVYVCVLVLKNRFVYEFLIRRHSLTLNYITTMIGGLVCVCVCVWGGCLVLSLQRNTLKNIWIAVKLDDKTSECVRFWRALKVMMCVCVCDVRVCTITCDS